MEIPYQETAGTAAAAAVSETAPVVSEAVPVGSGAAAGGAAAGEAAAGQAIVKPGVVVPGEVKKAGRIGWVDHARGLAIMLVVYRHVVVGMRRSGLAITDAMYNVQEVFYNFRMPVFFVLSGLFVGASLRRKSRVDILKDRAATILYPYLLWGTIMITLEILFSRYTNAKRSWSELANILIQPRGVDQLWYLFALFNTSLIYLGLSKLVKNAWVNGVIAIGLHALTFAAFLKGNSLVSDAFYYYCYFFLGSLLPGFLLDKTKSAGVLSARQLIWVVPVFLVGQWFWFTHREAEAVWYLLFIPINLVACYFVYILSYRISLKRFNDWLAYLGKYSLYIYILHVPIAAILRNVAGRSGLHPNLWIEIFICWSGGLLVPVLLYNGLRRIGFGKLFSLKNTAAA